MDSDKTDQPAADVTDETQPTVSEELPQFPETATPESMNAETEAPEAEAAEPTEPSSAENSKGTLAAEVEPLPEEIHRHEGRRWPLIGGLVVGAIAVAIGIFFLTRTIYRSAHHPTTQVTQSDVRQTPKPPETSAGSNTPTNQSAANSSGSTSTNSTSGNAIAPTNSSNSSAGNANSTSAALPNSGPGDVVAIFVITAGTAAGLHYIFSAHKTARR